MEVFKSLIAMFVAFCFILTASMFIELGLRKKEERKKAFLTAGLIVASSFFVWIPSLNVIFDAINLRGTAKIVTMIIISFVIVLMTIFTTIVVCKKKKT